MRKLAPLLLVLGLCACGSGTSATTTQTTTASPPPKPGHVTFTTSGPYAATCDIAYKSPGLGSRAYCVHYPPGEQRNAIAVVMKPSGAFRSCTGAKCVHKLYGSRKKVGATVTVGPFQCNVLANGVLCDVASSGKGFFLKGSRVQQVS